MQKQAILLKHFMAKGFKLLSNFTGIDDIESQHIELPHDDIVIELGTIEAIIYKAYDEGELKKFIHTFKKSSRPVLAVSDSGKQLYILAGKYIVTERGIEDV